MAAEDKFLLRVADLADRLSIRPVTLEDQKERCTLVFGTCRGDFDFCEIAMALLDKLEARADGR